jgi:hypothetical protein
MMLLDHKGVPALFVNVAHWFGRLIELPFSFVFFETHRTAKDLYNSEVGRLRIKKKEAVIPFRETLAYRMMLLAGSVIVFLIALYFLIGGLQAGITVSFVASGVVAAAGAFAVFYNADHLRNAKIPKQTLSRMKRR